MYRTRGEMGGEDVSFISLDTSMDQKYDVLWCGEFMQISSSV